MPNNTAQVLHQLEYALRWAADLRYDHVTDLREAVTGLPARPGTRR